MRAWVLVFSLLDNFLLVYCLKWVFMEVSKLFSLLCRFWVMCVCFCFCLLSMVLKVSIFCCCFSCWMCCFCNWADCVVSCCWVCRWKINLKFMDVLSSISKVISLMSLLCCCVFCWIFRFWMWRACFFLFVL